MSRPHTIPELAATTMPTRIAALPRDRRGYPVPYFVLWVKGEPRFQTVDTAKLIKAVETKRCWICGHQLGSYLAFVIGPMCSINRISSEPPSHRYCAEYALRVCPFLARPQMKRLPAKGDVPIVAPGGIMSEENPGISALWITKRFSPFRPEVGNDGVLFELGEPEEVVWYSGGKPASGAMVHRAFEAGAHKLRQITRRDPQGSLRALNLQIERARRGLPAVEAGAVW